MAQRLQPICSVQGRPVCSEQRVMAVANSKPASPGASLSGTARRQRTEQHSFQLVCCLGNTEGCPPRSARHCPGERRPQEQPLPAHPAAQASAEDRVLGPGGLGQEPPECSTQAFFLINSVQSSLFMEISTRNGVRNYMNQAPSSQRGSPKRNPDRQHQNPISRPRALKAGLSNLRLKAEMGLIIFAPCICVFCIATPL